MANIEQIINMSSQRKDPKLINDFHVLYPIREIEKPDDGRFVGLEVCKQESGEASDKQSDL